MIEEDKIVDAKTSIETEPDYHNRGECDGNLCSTKRLDQKKENEDSTSGSNNGGFGYVGLDNVKSLDGAKNRLRSGWSRSQY